MIATRCVKAAAAQSGARRLRSMSPASNTSSAKAPARTAGAKSMAPNSRCRSEKTWMRKDRPRQTRWNRPILSAPAGRRKGLMTCSGRVAARLSIPFLEKAMPATAAVTADYVHRDKRATPREGMTVGRSRLKWSNIGYADAPVPAEIEGLARDHVAKVGAEDDVGFVILHRCGGGNFYFLAVQTWRGQNEVWETVYRSEE